VSGDRAFRPKPLPKASVEAPLQPHWRTLPKEDAERLHARSLAEHRRFARFGPRTRRRLWRLGAGTTVSFLLVGWLLVGVVHWVVPATGLLVGLLVACVRMPDSFLPALYGGAAFAMIAVGLHGLHSALDVMRFGFGACLFACMGVLVGHSEEFRRLDGED
jgi:hypothetical protein